MITLFARTAGWLTWDRQEVGICFSVYRLVDRDLPGVEVPVPAVVRGLVVGAAEGGRVVGGPDGAVGPLAQLLDLTRVGAGGDGRVEGRRSDVLLDPVDNRLHVVLGVRAGLEGVGAAVGCARDQVELVPVAELGGVVGARVRVHGVADGLVVADGRGRRDRRVGLAVVVQQLAAVRLQRGQVGVAGLQAGVEALVANVHPVVQSIVGDAINSLQVVHVKHLDKLGSKGAAGAGRGNGPRLGSVVPGRGGIAKFRGRLPAVHDLFALGVQETVVQSLSESDSLSRHGSILRRRVAGSGCAGLTLAETESKTGAGLGSAVVRLADERGQVEVQAAKVGSRDDTIGSSIQRVAGGDRRIRNLGHLARRRNVAHLTLRDD